MPAASPRWSGSGSTLSPTSARARSTSARTAACPTSTGISRAERSALVAGAGRDRDLDAAVQQRDHAEPDHHLARAVPERAGAPEPGAARALTCQQHEAADDQQGRREQEPEADREVALHARSLAPVARPWVRRLVGRDD